MPIQNKKKPTIKIKTKKAQELNLELLGYINSLIFQLNLQQIDHKKRDKIHGMSSGKNKFSGKICPQIGSCRLDLS